ncbi:hypothetical protein KCU65_g23, partial [Aureobasidium melanogenum]
MPCDSFDRHFDNLIKPLVWRHIQFIFLRHILRQKPSTHKMSTLEPLDQWLWRRQTDQRIRVVPFSWTLVWRASLNIPTTGRERFANFAREGEAEDGVDYVVGGRELSGEV